MEEGVAGGATAQGLLQGILLPWESPEADFLDDIKTKVLRVFLLAIHSHLYSFAFEISISSNSRNLLEIFFRFSDCAL